jgi:choline-sulfatase
VGRLIDWLEAHGLRENTLVIFTGDNGMNMGHHGIYGKGNGTFPLNMYDTSVKVPMILSRPGLLPEGRVIRDLLSHYDLMPTLLDYAGLAPAESALLLPGHSFAGLVRDEPTKSRELVCVYDEYGSVRMIRTAEWKYVHRFVYGPHELYHLTEDPDEEHNLIADRAQQGRVTELQGEMDAWFFRHSDPAVDGSREPVAGSGQLNRAGSRGRGQKAFEQDWAYMADVLKDQEAVRRTGAAFI